MSHIILAVALLVGDSQIEQLPPVGPPGFALYSVRYKDGKGTLESRLFAVLYDADHKLLGEFASLPSPPQTF